MAKKIKPKPKQKAALMGILAGKSKRRAMLDAGYAKTTASHPRQELVDTVGFQKLIQFMDQYSIEKYGLASSDKAATAYIDALEANKLWGTGNNYVEIEDHPTRITAADRVLEVQGLRKQEETGGDIKILIENYAGGNTKILTIRQTEKST